MDSFTFYLMHLIYVTICCLFWSLKQFFFEPWNTLKWEKRAKTNAQKCFKCVSTPGFFAMRRFIHRGRQQCVRQSHSVYSVCKLCLSSSFSVIQWHFNILICVIIFYFHPLFCLSVLQECVSADLWPLEAAAHDPAWPVWF